MKNELKKQYDKINKTLLEQSEVAMLSEAMQFISDYVANLINGTNALRSIMEDENITGARKSLSMLHRKLRERAQRIAGSESDECKRIFAVAQNVVYLLQMLDNCKNAIDNLLANLALEIDH